MNANSSTQKRRTRAVISAVSLLAAAGLLIWPPDRGSLAQQDRQLARTGSTNASNGRRIALVIGNGAYPTAPLKNPVNDAHDIAAALGALGFEVISRENASQNDMKRAIREFGEKIRGAAVGLFYYAGHGVQVNGENYLVPVDAKVESEQEVEYECVKAGFVLAQMDAARNTMNIVILDACRNNPFARSFRSESKGLAQMDAPSGTLIAYATAPGSIASDGAGRNGLYTQELLKEMQTPGLAIEDVFKRVRISVRAATQQKQTPWESSSLVGDFYFSAAAGAKSAPPLSNGDGNTTREPTSPTNAIASLTKNVETAKAQSPEPARDLHAAVFNYKASIVMGAQSIPMTIKTEIKDAGSSWLVNETALTPQGAISDTSTIEKGSLVITHRSITQGPVVIEIDFKDNKATGTMTVSGQPRPIAVDLGGPVFADGGGAFDVLAALPLADGYSTSYRNLDIEKQKLSIKNLKVVGSESVTVAAGTFDAYKVELVSADNDADKTTLWIAKDSRKVLKITAILQSINGVLTSELTR